MPSEILQLPRRSLAPGDLAVGHVFATPARTVAEADIANFAGVSGDHDPLHIDELTARQRGFPGRIAHGPLLIAILSGLVAQSALFCGIDVALLGVSIDVHRPVPIGTTLAARLRVREKRVSRSNSDRTVLFLEYELFNQLTGDVVATGEWKELIVTDE